MKIRVSILLLVLVVAGCRTTLSPKPVVPPNGGAAIVVGGNGWRFSGVERSGMESFEVGYPQAEETELLKVINADFILANAYGKRSQIIYSFDVNVKNIPQDLVYTRVILENPADSSLPIVYEHHFNKNERLIQVIHGPLNNVVMHKKYTIKLQLFEDAERTKLIDEVAQVVVSSLDNTSGCVELSSDYKKIYFEGTKDPKGNVIPIDKLMIWCAL